MLGQNFDQEADNGAEVFRLWLKIDSTAFQFPNDYKLPTVCKFNLQLHKVNKPQQELGNEVFTLLKSEGRLLFATYTTTFARGSAASWCNWN